MVLTFDRAVDIAGLDGGAITVDDGTIMSLLYDGTGGASLLDPVTVKVFLTELGTTSSTRTTLSATAANGVVAADDDHAPWAGASGVELPFP